MWRFWTRNFHLISCSSASFFSGTGLFLGTGGALANGGPLGLFMGYALMGSICYSVMVSDLSGSRKFSPRQAALLDTDDSKISLGEMVSYLPLPGGHLTMAARFADRSLAFAMGWNYWFNWASLEPDFSPLGA